MPKANLKIISITSCAALAALNALALFYLKRAISASI